MSCSKVPTGGSAPIIQEVTSALGTATRMVSTGQTKTVNIKEELALLGAQVEEMEEINDKKELLGGRM